MSAFLKKLFKPKWKSSNAITRKEYISTLNPATEEDKNILLDLARNDSDNQVRRAAINKIDSVSALLNLYQDPSDLIKPAVKDRLEGIAKSNSLPIYELITDESLLVELIVNAENADQYKGALAKLSPQTLQTIAISAKLNQLRFSAIELVSDEASLVVIEKQAKTKDKKVYQLAKSKLKEIKTIKKQLTETKEKQEALIQSLESHSKSETVKLYNAKLTSLLDAWDNISECKDEQLLQRFNISKQTCLLKAEQYIKAQEEAELAIKKQQEQVIERQETLKTLQQTTERFNITAIESASELSALDAIIKTQETRWLEATKDCIVEKTDQKQYQSLMNNLRHYLKSAQYFIDNKSQFSSLEACEQSPNKHNVEDLKQIKAFITQVDWPNGFIAPPLLKLLSKTAETISDQRKQNIQDTGKLKQDIEEQLNLLEKDLSNRALKPSSQRFKELNHLFHGVDKSVSTQYSGRLQLLGNQLDELRDWHGYAVIPKQTELCEHIERLAEQHLAPQVKADKIKELQDEWKKLGGSSDQKIWLRFKAGCDAAYAPCRDYFDEQKALKKSNVEKRKTICEQVGSFVSQNDWANADWKAVEKINRTAREEWKACYPVEFKENKVVQKSFNDLLATIDQYLDEERARNKQLKQTIVEKTQALIDHEPLSEAIEGAKSLQSEWQQVGITLHKDDRNLWKEYRAACDEIFKRRDVANESKQQAVNDAIAEAEALCNEAQTIATDADSVSEKTLIALRQRFKEISSLPKKEYEKFNKVFDSIINTLKSDNAKKKAAKESALWFEANRQSKRIKDAAQKIFAGEPPESITPIADEIVQSSPTHYLESTLQKAWEQLINTSGELRPISVEHAKNICIQCEIAAEIESPKEDQPLRMQLQVNRLSQGINSQQDSGNKQAELEKYLVEWFQIYLVPEEIRASLENRIDKVLATRTQ